MQLPSDPKAVLTKLHENLNSTITHSFHSRSWPVIWRMLFIFAIIFSTPLSRNQLAQAEGSKELTAIGGFRPWLEYNNGTLGGDLTAGVINQNLIKVYARAGETINLGSSAMGIGTGDINYTAPNGTIGSCSTQGAGRGLIANRLEELAGPSTIAPGGYTPCIITATATTEGVWEIEFTSPNPANYSPTPILANAAWVQPNNSHIAAWDITVLTGTTPITGRVYANYLPLNLGDFNNDLNSNFHILTKDGYQYRINTNGVEPFAFVFFANNKGFTDLGNKLLYKSINLGPGTTLPPGISFQNPRNPDTPISITHKIFFNPPSVDLPTAALAPGGGSTWLLTAPKPAPTVSNFEFTGSEGTPGQAGTGKGGSFSFDTTAAGSYQIVLDINNNNVYGDGPDRILLGEAITGTNTVFWDGLDDLGAIVPAGTTPYATEIRLGVGEVHFPFLDPEDNPNGLIIERLNGPNFPDFVIYYDDSDITGGGTPPNPIRVLTGTSSIAGAHQFDNNFGDDKGIDTWSLVFFEPITLTGNLLVAQADLQINKTFSPSPTLPNGPLTYTLIVTNAGPSHVTGAKVGDNIPSQITGVSWNCNLISGIGNCGPPASGTGNNISTTVDLNNGAVAGFTIVGTVDPATRGNLVNTATVTRPNDVTDPITSNNTSTVTTTVVAQPVLHLDKGVTPTGSIIPGQTLTYTLCYSNNGSLPATGVVITDFVPANTTYITGSATTSPTVEYNDGTGWSGTEPVSGTSGLRWLIGNLPADRTTRCVSFGIRTKTTARMNIVNSATLASNEVGPETDTVETPLIIQVDPAITKAANVSQALPGDVVTFTITTHNNGTIDITGVAVVDPVPASLDILGVSSLPSHPTQIVGQVFTVTIGTMSPAESVLITLRTRVNDNAASGTQQIIRNTTTLHFKEGPPRNASAEISVPAAASPPDPDSDNSPPPPPIPTPLPVVQATPTLPVHFLPSTGIGKAQPGEARGDMGLLLLALIGISIVTLFIWPRLKKKR